MMTMNVVRHCMITTGHGGRDTGHGTRDTGEGTDSVGPVESGDGLHDHEGRGEGRVGWCG